MPITAPFFCQRRLPLFVGFFVALVLCGWVPGVAAFELVMGKVSDDPQKAIAELRPMVEYAAAQLADEGVTGGQVRLFPSEDALQAAVKAGAVHWITETSLVAANLMNRADATLAVKKWKNGQREYQTYIYSLADGPVRTLADLKGRVIAFEHEESFSSYYVPRLILEQAGYQLHYLSSVNDAPVADKVNYVFSRNEKNNALWVDKGLVDAGALNNNDWLNGKRVPETLRQRFLVIHQSSSFPRAYELFGPGMPPAIGEKLRQLLLGMRLSTHASVLQKYEKTSRFEAITREEIDQLDQFFKVSRQW